MQIGHSLSSEKVFYLCLTRLSCHKMFKVCISYNKIKSHNNSTSSNITCTFLIAYSSCFLWRFVSTTEFPYVYVFSPTRLQTCLSNPFSTAPHLMLHLIKIHNLLITIHNLIPIGLSQYTIKFLLNSNILGFIHITSKIFSFCFWVVGC